MASAWRRAKSHGKAGHTTAAPRGVAGAFCIALRQVGWLSAAFNVVITRQGHPLHLDVVDPKIVLRHLQDDWDIAIAITATHQWYTNKASKLYASRRRQGTAHPLQTEESLVIDGQESPRAATRWSSIDVDEGSTSKGGHTALVTADDLN